MNTCPTLHPALFRIVWLLITISGCLSVPASAGIKRTFQSAEEVLAVLSNNTELQRNGVWHEPLVETAGAEITKAAKGQKLVFRGKVEWLAKSREGFRIKFPDRKIKHGKVVVDCRVLAIFNANQTTKLSEVGEGDDIIVTGRLSRADLKLYGGRPWLTLDLREPEIHVAP